MIYTKSYGVCDTFVENQNVEFYTVRLMGKDITLAVSQGQGRESLEKCYDYALAGVNPPPKAISSEEPSELMLQPLDPTLVKKYQGIEVHNSQGITIAVYHPDKGSYYRWTGTEWEATDEPIFQTIAQINEGIGCWGGAIQLRLRLDKTARWQCLTIGYEVNIDLADWILRFGLPNYLRKPIDFSYVAECSNGSNIEPPPYVKLEEMMDIQVQPFGEKCYPATGDVGCDRIALSTPIKPGNCQVHYKLTPKIDYIYGEHFISETPCVTVRSLGEMNRRHPVWQTPVGNNLNPLTYIYDLEFEIVVIANDIAMARTIGHEFYSRIRHDARLHAYPIDQSYGLNIHSDGLRENNLPEVEGNIPSINIIGRIYNLPVTG